MAAVTEDGVLQVGQKARASLGPGKSRRCLVLCVGDENGLRTYDVMLIPPKYSQPTRQAANTNSIDTAEADRAENTEIPGLPASDLSPLQPFELDDSFQRFDGGIPHGLEAEDLCTRAEALKDKGNALFKLGDTEAAAEVFIKVLRALEPPPAVGANVLVRSNFQQGETTTVRYRPAVVSDTTGGDDDDDMSNSRSVSYDVIYDETDADGEDEEDGVTGDRVFGAPRVSPCVSCAARLNLARCLFKASMYSEVVDACTLVISLAKVLMVEKNRPREERLGLRGHCFTAFRLRGGAHLAQNHIGLARKDAKNMARLAGDDDADGRGQAARFEAEVEKKSKALLKANRKLARDVSQWVNASMAKHEEASVGGTDDCDRRVGVDSRGPPPARESSHGVEESKGFAEEEDATHGGVQGESGGGVGSWLHSWIR